MRVIRQLVPALLIVSLLSGGAQAWDEGGNALSPSDARTPQPRASITAALMNVFFLPVRIPVTVLGAHVAGLTGFLTGGNKHAADDVFDLVNGTQVVTPRMLEERRGFRFSAYD